MGEQNRNSLERLLDRLSLRGDLFAKPPITLLKVGGLPVESLDFRPEDEFLEVSCGAKQGTLLATCSCKVTVDFNNSQTTWNEPERKQRKTCLPSFSPTAPLKILRRSLPIALEKNLKSCRAEVIVTKWAIPRSVD